MWKLLVCAKAVWGATKTTAMGSPSKAIRPSERRERRIECLDIIGHAFGGRKNSAPQYSQRMTPLPATTWGAPQLGHLPVTTAWLMTAASEETSLPTFQSTYPVKRPLPTRS